MRHAVRQGVLRGVLPGAYITISIIAMPQQARGERVIELATRAEASDSTRNYVEAVRLWRGVFAIDGGDPAPLYFAARSAARGDERDTAFALLSRAIGDGLVLRHPLADYLAMFGVRYTPPAGHCSE